MHELSKYTHRLGYGYNAGLPERFRAAWGARAILGLCNSVDLVHNRQDTLGPEDQVSYLLDQLNGSVNKEWTANVADLDIRADRAEEFTVYDKDGLVVKVNALASYGYLYVVAYLEA
jgi:hypothetical protein